MNNNNFSPFGFRQIVYALSEGKPKAIVDKMINEILKDTYGCTDEEIAKSQKEFDEYYYSGKY